MTRSVRNIAVAALVGAGLIAFGSPAEAAPISIRTLAAEQVRLSTIAYRIGAANSDLCHVRAFLPGIVTHDLTEYAPSARPAISRAFSLSTGVGIVGIVPGSAAAKAGLQVDDEILQIGSVSVEDTSVFQATGQSYDRLDHVSTVLSDALTAGPANLLVRRNGRLLHTQVGGQPTCGGSLVLTNSPELNAWSDGSHVVLTTGMVRLARSDDEIAFVVAHEMAHNLLGHSDGRAKRRGIFGGLSQARRDELQADGFAVRLVSRAGYRPQGGIDFLQTVSSRLWWAMSLDHPGFGSRMRTVEAAISAMPSWPARNFGTASSAPARMESVAYRTAAVQSSEVLASAADFQRSRSDSIRTAFASPTFRTRQTICEL